MPTKAAPNSLLNLSIIHWSLSKSRDVLSKLATVGRQFEPYLWHPCGVTWDFGPEQQAQHPAALHTWQRQDVSHHDSGLTLRAELGHHSVHVDNTLAKGLMRASQLNCRLIAAIQLRWTACSSTSASPMTAPKRCSHSWACSTAWTSCFAADQTG